MGSVPYTTYRGPNLEGVWRLAIRNLHRLTPARVTVPDQARDLPLGALASEVSEHPHAGVTSTPISPLAQAQISSMYPLIFSEVSSQFSMTEILKVSSQFFYSRVSEVSSQFSCPIEVDNPMCSKVVPVPCGLMTKIDCRICNLPIDRSNTPSGNFQSVSTCGKCYLKMKRAERESRGEV